jgi:hypothetical protein
MARQRDRATALSHPVICTRGGVGAHTIRYGSSRCPPRTSHLLCGQLRARRIRPPRCSPGLSGIPSSCRRATARATAHVPNKRVTTLAAGNSPRPAARAPLPQAAARARATSRRTSAAGRSARAIHASRRAAVLGSSAARSRPGGTPCSTRMRPFAVARLRVRPAAAADADVAGLHRPRLLAHGVPSVQKALASIRAERSQHAEEDVVFVRVSEQGDRDEENFHSTKAQLARRSYGARTRATTSSMHSRKST